MSLVEYIAIESQNDILRVAKLGATLLRDTYSKFLSSQTVDAIIRTLYTSASIKKQLHLGIKFHFIVIESNIVGYFSYKINREKEELFFSQLFILSEYRGLGLCRGVVSCLSSICSEESLSSITLHVLSENRVAIEIYKHCGFVIRERTVKRFVDNESISDFVMSLNIMLIN